MASCYKRYYLPLFLSIPILSFLSFSAFSEDAISIIGGQILNGENGDMKFIVDPESILANIKLGDLTYVKNSLDSYVIEDKQKESEVLELLSDRENKAEDAYQQYLKLNQSANGNLKKLIEAKVWLEKAMTLWTDNSEYHVAKHEIDDVIMLVETGRYQEEQARKEKEMEIKSLIKDAKVCKEDNDCIRASFNCFTCSTAINQSMLEQLNNKVDFYLKQTGMVCMYDCFSPASLEPKCIENMCKLAEP